MLPGEESSRSVGGCLFFAARDLTCDRMVSRETLRTAAISARVEPARRFTATAISAVVSENRLLRRLVGSFRAPSGSVINKRACPDGVWPDDQVDAKRQNANEQRATARAPFESDGPSRLRMRLPAQAEIAQAISAFNFDCCKHWWR